MLDAAPAAPAGHDFIAHEYRKGFIDGQISMREQFAPAAPVAWRYQMHGDTLFTQNAALASHAVAAGLDAVPLYLHPPPADARSTRAALIELTVETEQQSAELARLRALLREARIHAPTDLLRKIEEEMAQWR